MSAAQVGTPLTRDGDESLGFVQSTRPSSEKSVDYGNTSMRSDTGDFHQYAHVEDATSISSSHFLERGSINRRTAEFVPRRASAGGTSEVTPTMEAAVALDVNHADDISRASSQSYFDTFDDEHGRQPQHQATSREDLFQPVKEDQVASSTAKYQTHSSDQLHPEHSATHPQFTNLGMTNSEAHMQLEPEYLSATSGIDTHVSSGPDSEEQNPAASVTAPPQIYDKCTRIWAMLWHPKKKLRINIPYSVVFRNGEFFTCLFTSNAGETQGEVHRRPASLTTEEVCEKLERRATLDAANITSYVAMVQHDDEHSAAITREALWPVMQHIGVPPPRPDGSSSSNHSQPHPDLYQVVRAYVHPYLGLRYTTTYTCEQPRVAYTTLLSHGRSAFNLLFQQTTQDSRPVVDLNTEVSRFIDKYAVLGSDADYFALALPTPSQSANESQMSLFDAAGHIILPEVLRRECERMTLAVVAFLSLAHNVLVKRLVCEFVQDFNKRLVMISIEDVELSGKVNTDTVQLPLKSQAALSHGPSVGALALARRVVEELEELGVDRPQTESEIYCPPVLPLPAGSNSTTYESAQSTSRGSIRPKSGGSKGRGVTSAKQTATSTSTGSKASTSTPGASTSTTSSIPAHHSTEGQYDYLDELAEEQRLSHVIGSTGGGASVADKQVSRDDQLPRAARPKSAQLSNKTARLLGSGAASAEQSSAGTNRAQSRLRENRDAVFERLTQPTSATSAASAATPGLAPSTAVETEFLMLHWRHAARTLRETLLRREDELQKAKQQVADLQQELTKEQERHAATAGRLLVAGEAASEEIERLREEIRSLKSSSRLAAAERALADAHDQIEKDRVRIAELESEAAHAKTLQSENLRLNEELARLRALTKDMQDPEGLPNSPTARRVVEEAKAKISELQDALSEERKSSQSLLIRAKANEFHCLTMAQFLDLLGITFNFVEDASSQPPMSSNSGLTSSISPSTSQQLPPPSHDSENSGTVGYDSGTGASSSSSSTSTSSSSASASSSSSGTSSPKYSNYMQAVCERMMILALQEPNASGGSSIKMTPSEVSAFVKKHYANFRSVILRAIQGDASWPLAKNLIQHDPAFNGARPNRLGTAFNIFSRLLATSHPVVTVRNVTSEGQHE